MTYPTGAIIFTAILGATREPRSWYLAAHRAESRESISVNLTGEEVVRVLRIEAVVAALKGLGWTLVSNDLVAQLTERVAELQRTNDAMRRDPAVIGNEAQQILRNRFPDKTWVEVDLEILRLQKQDANIRRIGTEPGYCTPMDDAVAQSLKEPTLAKALSLIATWDNERAVRQAMRNVGSDNRKDTSHGGLWDTTFEYLFTRVLDGWQLMIANEPVLLERMRVAESLWQLLDDIDSQGVAIKPGDMVGFREYHRRAVAIAARRHEFLKSDGNHLTWPDGDKSERKSSYTFAEIPEHDPAIYAKYEDLKSALDLALKGEGWAVSFPGHADLVRQVTELQRVPAPHQAHPARTITSEKNVPQEPVPMLLFCPMCHTKHIDEGEFATRVHTTHACQGWVTISSEQKLGVHHQRRCGHVWRPAIVPTVGVEALPGFINEPTSV